MNNKIIEKIWDSIQNSFGIVSQIKIESEIKSYLIQSVNKELDARLNMMFDLYFAETELLEFIILLYNITSSYIADENKAYALAIAFAAYRIEKDYFIN